MRLSLFDRREGVATGPGNRAVYDVAANEARFGAAAVSGRALVWELHEGEKSGALLSAAVELDPAVEWLMRCDRVDFPPGGIAHLHTHPGPGVRCLLFGSIRIDTEGGSTEHGPFAAWFESGPVPVRATASESEATAFVRVMLLPREWEGKRTIHYVDDEDATKPKTQRASVFFEQPIRL